MVLQNFKENKLSVIQIMMLLGLLLFYILTTLFFDKIPVNDGLGWDGLNYYNITSDFTHQFTTGKIKIYNLKRCFPIVIIHYFIKFIDFVWSLFGGQPILPTIPVVINCFSLFNILGILTSNFFLFKIYEKFNFSNLQQFFCFIIFNLVFPISKLITYYPVLTDYYAVLFSVLLLYAYLQERTRLIFILFIIGYFTFPTLSIVSFFLFIFPYNQVTKRKIVISNSYNKTTYFTIVGLLIIIFLCGMHIIFFKYTILYFLFDRKAPINLSLFPLNVIATVTYFIAIARLFYPLNIIQHSLVNIRLRKLIFLMLTVIVLSQTIKFHFKIEGFALHTFLKHLVMQNLQQPFVSFFCHYFYFGIAYLVPLLFYRQWNILLDKLGIGVILVILAHFILMIGSETRQFITILPFLAVSSGILVKNFSNLTPKSVGIFTAISFITSTVWLPINIKNYQFRTLSPSEMPYLHAIHQGPWMPPEFYPILLVLTLLSCGILVYLLKPFKQIAK